MELLMSSVPESGIIIKCLGGLYSVESPTGIYECKARGVFRSKGISPSVGDGVTVENGVITEVTPRRNYIIRPPLANLDQIIFIVSTVSPPPNLLLLDKFIAVAEYKGITPVVVITKTDLGDSSMIHEIYEKIGIKVLEVNYNASETVEAVRGVLKGRISAFTGNSGAGKSTLLNAVDPSLEIPTGEISRKLGRGRHTTRHAELYKLAEGGYDIVMANILADVIVPLSGFVSSFMKKGGIFTASGIIDTKLAEVEAAINANTDLAITDISRDGEWRAVSARRR